MVNTLWFFEFWYIYHTSQLVPNIFINRSHYSQILEPLDVFPNFFVSPSFFWACSSREKKHVIPPRIWSKCSSMISILAGHLASRLAPPPQIHLDRSKLEIFPCFPLQKGRAERLGFPWKSIVLRMKKNGKFHRISSFFLGGSISYLCHVFSFAGLWLKFFSHLWQDHRIFQIFLPSKFFFSRFLRKHLSVTISSGDLLDDFQWSFEHGDQKLMYFEARRRRWSIDGFGGLPREFWCPC